MSANAHKKVVRLDVSVNEIFRMNVLDTANHLVSKHQNCLHREAAGAKIKEILQRRAQQIHNQHIVVALLPIPPKMEKKNQCIA